MGAITGLEERDVGRPQASETTQAGEEDGVLGLMMPEEETSGGAGLRNDHVDGRCVGDRMQ